MKLKHFVARHRIQDDKWCDLYYVSLKQAKYFNPYMKDWKEVE